MRRAVRKLRAGAKRASIARIFVTLAKECTIAAANMGTIVCALSPSFTVEARYAGSMRRCTYMAIALVAACGSPSLFGDGNDGGVADLSATPPLDLAGVI